MSLLFVMYRILDVRFRQYSVQDRTLPCAKSGYRPMSLREHFLQAFTVTSKKTMRTMMIIRTSAMCQHLAIFNP